MTITAVQTPEAIRAFFSEQLNDSVFAHQVTGTTETKAAHLALRSDRQVFGMYVHLCEGTLGRSFRAFQASDPDAALRIIKVAIRQMRPWCENWDKNAQCARIGAFAHAFTEVVAEMAEPHLSPMVNHFGNNAWMCDAWDWFASNVATGPNQTNQA